MEIMCQIISFDLSLKGKSMGKALLLVDLQVDFVDGGVLGVSGGKEMCRLLSEWISHEANQYDMIMATRDWHDPDGDNGGHFALNAEADYVTTWPVHCVAESAGAQYATEFNDELVTHHIYKGQSEPGYSCFDGCDATGVSAHDVLKAHDIEHVDVCGIAADYCVKNTVLDACALEFGVRVLSQYVLGIDPESTRQAYADMAQAGAQILL